MDDDGFNPQEKDLYKVLGVERTASAADIKKAYYRLAVKLHPDKNPGDEAAKAGFQALQRVYAVLSDEQKRRLYDRTGSLQDSEELTGEAFQDLYEAYRRVYPQVTEDDIAEFEAGYRGSPEERRDLLALYAQAEGRMPHVFAYLMCSRPEIDSHRFLADIEAAVAAGEVQQYEVFKRWGARVRKTPPPKQDPLAPRNKGRSSGEGGGKGGDEAELVTAIRSRCAGGDGGLLAALEARYASGSSGGGKRKKGATAAAGAANPTDEEFEAASARLQAKRKQPPQQPRKKNGKKVGKA